MKNNEGLKPKEMTKESSIKKLLQGKNYFFHILDINSITKYIIK
jgi:hypothetical protein